MAAAPLPHLFFPAGAGENDDEFGDFEFALPPPIAVTTTSSSVVVDEDEWGDFVESPIHLQPRSDNHEEKPWHMSRGAIPLSIFGEEEADDTAASVGSGAKDPFFSPGNSAGLDLSGKDSFFSPRKDEGVDIGRKDSIFSPRKDVGVDFGGKGSLFSPKAVPIRDLLDDLYRQVDRVDEKGGVDGNGVLMVEEKGVEVDEDDGGWEFKGAMADGVFGDGLMQVAENDIKKKNLQLIVDNSLQEMDNRGLEDAFSGSSDLFTVAAWTAGPEYKLDEVFNTKNGLTPNLANGIARFGKTPFEVMDAVPKAELDLFQWKEEVGNDASLSSTIANSGISGGEFQDLGNLWGSHAENVAVCAFGAGKEDPNCFSDTQKDFFMFEQTSMKSHDTDVKHLSSFNDLLVGLYEDQNGNHSATEVASLNNVSYGNGLQDSHMPVANCFSEGHQGDDKPAPETFVGFYSKLKDASCLLALYHLGDLKKVHELAALSTETKVREVQLQIQDAFTKLQHEVENSENVVIDECCISQVSFDELLERLKHPKLQALDIEYSLSEKIKLAQDDLTSAILLFEHADITLRILKMGHSQEQQNCISAWSSVLSVCEQELQHGATILSHSLQAGIREKILLDPKGTKYFLALGEIYRTAEILKTTLTVYKPWLMLNPPGSKDPLAIGNRCYKFWMDAGLREGLEDISDQADLNTKEKIKRIFESINLIRSSNVVAIQSHGEPACHLSLLPQSMFQGMDIVAWDGENYFVKIANLWANRISNVSPKLSCTIDD